MKTTHQLAKELLAGPDVPLNDSGIIQTEPHIHNWQWNPTVQARQCIKCLELDLAWKPIPGVECSEKGMTFLSKPDTDP